jgi:hypothetical protein
MKQLPHIYGLVLDEEPWKANALSAHLDTLRLSATLLAGFHGATLGLRPTNPFALAANGTPEFIHANTLGCYLSHIAALRIALATDDPDWIILEEDALLAPDFADRFPEVRHSLPDTISLLNLELFDADRSKPHKPINNHASTIYWPFGACGLWWRRDAAELAVRHLRPICEPYDIALMHRVYPFLHHASCTTSLVTQRSASGNWPSTIDAMDKTVT